MNPSDLENELRSLIPASPPARLEQTIAREIGEGIRPATAGVLARDQRARAAGGLLSRLCWALGGAAVATVATVLAVNAGTNPSSPEPVLAKVQPSVFEPVATSRELLDAEESDLVYADDAPARIVRYSSRERHVWTNPSTGALVEVEVPRQDVMLVPVSFQ